MSKAAYVYVQNTLSDWEPGYVTAELNSGRYFKNKGERIEVMTVGVTTDSVVTAGGMTITPDTTLDTVTANSSAMFMLLGADNWSDPQHQPAIDKARELLEAGANVAAICGATGALANAGFFDHRSHTSNAPEYLKMIAPNYRGEAYFKQKRAIKDGNLITASSAGPLEYARLVIEELEVFSPEVLDAWYQYFDTGDPQYFFTLMQALPQ